MVQATPESRNELRIYDVETLLELYERMCSIRRFEERVSELFKNGKIPGFVHLYLGQEAIAVGVCSALRKDDYITSTHRGHGHVIAKGGNINRMMAELFGKRTGCCKGKGGSMHITDMSIGMLGANGIVAGGLPIALGAAYSASRLRKTDQVIVAFFGDGATAEGAFHETCNVAALWKLPLIFVCENNQFGVGTNVRDSSPFPDLIHRVDSYGIPAVSVDGNAVLAVREAAQEAVANARQGRGPTFIECKTWRHHGHFEGEDLKYRDPNEHQAWMKKDPIERFARMLVESGVVSGDLLVTINAEAFTRVDQAVRFAEESPYPEPAEALKDVFVDYGA